MPLHRIFFLKIFYLVTIETPLVEYFNRFYNQKLFGTFSVKVFFLNCFWFDLIFSLESANWKHFCINKKKLCNCFYKVSGTFKIDWFSFVKKIDINYMYNKDFQLVFCWCCLKCKLLSQAIFYNILTDLIIGFLLLTRALFHEKKRFF